MGYEGGPGGGGFLSLSFVFELDEMDTSLYRSMNSLLPWKFVLKLSAPLY